MNNKTSMETFLAWGVHLYTALGGVLGFFALYAVVRDNYIAAFTLLLLSSVIDATDGILARTVDVKRVLPFFDGSMLDNVIDIFTYAWVPIFIIEKLTSLNVVFVVFPIVAALYAYGQVNMKTEDNYFLGFPTYWNIVALYFYLLAIDGVLGIAILALFSVLTFVPTRYLYPSKHANRFYRLFFLIGGAVWILLICYVLVVPNYMLTLLSLFYPLAYLGLSFYEDWKIRKSPLSQVQANIVE